MSAVSSKPGSLYVVATPIGNLADISRRAGEILAQVDMIAAEDTRHSMRLLAHLGISRPLLSLHEHNEATQSQVIVDKISQGEDVALISDAGTPLISDPGFKLVDLAHRAGLKVVPVPGASAVMAALSASGIATNRYRFIGFLPSRASQRRQVLKELLHDASTLVFFESPHRIGQSLADFCAVFGAGRRACFCRELTKQFETIVRGTLDELNHFVNADDNQRRGEIVVVVAGNDKDDQPFDGMDYRVLMQAMLETMPLKQAASVLAKASGRPRREFYQLGLELKAGERSGEI